MAAAQKYPIRIWVGASQIRVKASGGDRFQSKYWEYQAEYDHSGRLVGRPVRPLTTDYMLQDETEYKVTVPVGRIALDVAEIISQQPDLTAYIEEAVREKYQREH